MNPDLPPPNRAIGWYRFMLWMMPTCIALTTAFGVGWLNTIVRIDSDLMVNGSFGLNISSTVGIAIFEAKLRNQSEPPMLLRFKSRAILFFLLQLLIVPAIAFAIFFAACLVIS